MTAIKRSRTALLCLTLAVASLMGVFAILDASSANASQGERDTLSPLSPTSIIINPPELQATLYPNEQVTRTLWITNTSNTPITYTIFEMTSSLRTAGYTLAPKADPLIVPKVQAQVDVNGRALVIIDLRPIPDLSQAYLIPNKTARRVYVYNRLLDTAQLSQDLFDWLVSQGAYPEHLLAGNAIAANVNASQLAQLAQDRMVAQVRLNRQTARITVDEPRAALPALPAFAADKPDAVEWNIARIRADQVWSALGITGQGAVIGIMDTGVLYSHAGLVNSYRGNLGDGSFNHNFNWYDWVSGQPVPYDGMGHGTMMTGIVTGDDGGVNQIGVAPGAAWIAVKACSDAGSCSDYSILHSFEWLMAPTDLNGQNADPSKAPDIVLAGWGSGGCDGYWQFAIMALRAAGILPVFSGGNSGPTCGSIGSPADYPGVLTAGLTDQSDVVFDSSPRGSSCFGLAKPDVTAPGVNIRSSFSDGGYTTWSGSAESSAHLAGVAALMVSADSFLGAGTIEPILFASTACQEDLSCGGEACPGANNVYGYGRIDAYQAVYLTLRNLPHADLPWLNEQPINGTIPAGEAVPVEVTFSSSGLEPGVYSGNLGILTSDATQPLTIIDARLEVLSSPTPVIAIDPLSFSANLPVGAVQTDTLTIRNDGDAVLTYTLYEVTRTRNLLTPPIVDSVPNPYPANAPAVVDDRVHTQLLIFGQSRLILFLRGAMDFSAPGRLASRFERSQYVYHQLLKLASQSDDLFTWLEAQGTQPRRLLTANAIAATLDEEQLRQVLQFTQVGRVSINNYHDIPQDLRNLNPLQLNKANIPGTVEWNIAKIRADEAWSTFGITGQGAVVGIIDTGVIYNHPALVNSYRGNLGSGIFDHNYNWFDFVNGQPVPYDPVNHGTMGAGIISGDDGGINQIGVAPGADWIAVRACDFSCTDEDLLAAFQWMLAPTDLSNSNPDPSEAPDVVIGMWGGQGCSNFFESSLVALRNAGILPVFPPGSSGSGCATMGSPGDLPEALAAGATDLNDNIAIFSSRGPSCYDEIKPDLSAPGVEIRTSNNMGGYMITSGTSWSAAHLAGSALMVISANPALGPDDIEAILFSTAVCREQLVCGGAACPSPNNTYGYGRIDVFEAVSASLTAPVDIPWLTAGPLQGELQPGEVLTTSVVVNSGGMQPGTYRAGIAIQSNDPLAPFTTLPVTMTVFVPCQPLSEVAASFTPLQPFVGDLVSFTASASGTLPITYTWSFEDGSSAMGPETSFIFTTPGIHVVNLQVENACSTPVSLEINVPVQALIRNYMLPLVLK